MYESSLIRSATDFERALVTSVTFEVDPTYIGWLRGGFEGGYIYLRLNDFPAEPLYSVVVGDGEYIDLEELPSNWIRGRLAWPSTAVLPPVAGPSQSGWPRRAAKWENKYS